MQRDTPQLTRRRAIALAGTSAVGGIALLHTGSDSAKASVDVGDFELHGESATVDDPPQRVAVSASGEFSVDSTDTPELIEVTLQAHVKGQVDDLANDAVFDQSSGTFDFDTNLLAHRDIDAEDITPENPDETLETDVTIRVIVSVTSNGQIVAEDFAEASDVLSITRSGVEIHIGGSASLTVEE